jgi:ribonucleoside-diphosphate reductase alpha chain
VAKKAEVIDLMARRAVRMKLPDERQSLTHKFSIAGHEGYLTVGLYPNGDPGEIFLRMAKEGSTISGLMDSIATMTSIALQYGVPLKALVDKFSHTRFEPSGFTNNPEIPLAKSVTDYVFRYLGNRFCHDEGPRRTRVREGSVAPRFLTGAIFPEFIRWKPTNAASPASTILATSAMPAVSG